MRVKLGDGVDFNQLKSCTLFHKFGLSKSRPAASHNGRHDSTSEGDNREYVIALQFS